MPRSPRKNEPPKFIQPMAARVVDRLPEGDEWMYEVKFDGYRALLLKSGTHVQIRSRNDKDLTNTYPSVVASGRRLRADQAVIDGEIVAVDADGRPSFQALQHRGAYAVSALCAKGAFVSSPAPKWSTRVSRWGRRGSSRDLVRSELATFSTVSAASSMHPQS